MTETSTRFSRMSWQVVTWMVAAAALHFPLSQYLALDTAIIQPVRHALVFAVLIALSVAIVLFIDRAGIARSTAAYAFMALWVVFWSGSRFVSALGVAGGVVAAAVLWTVVVIIVHRLRHLPAVHMVFFAWAVFLTLSPWAAHLDLADTTERDESSMTASQVEYRGGDYRPDVYVVMLDAYSGIQTLATYDGWDGAVVDQLEAQGFRVTPAWTAYATTSFSLAGVLDASYPVEPQDGAATEILADDHLITGGEAAVLRFFDEAGYVMTTLEPPWVGYRCAPLIDTCIEPAFLDGLLYYTLDHSFIGPLLDSQLGSAWTYGALRTWDWLADHAEELAQNGEPDFVFTHVIAPHEPFLLDAACEVSYDSEFDVVTIQAAEESSGTQAYLEQARCMDRKMAELADLVPEDAIVVFIGDHGAALSGQSGRFPADWTAEDLSERMSAFFAMRAPAECQPTSPVMIQNVFRGVMRCMGGSDLDDLAPRLFPTNLYAEDGKRRMVELSDEEVEVIVGSMDP